ncbi:MAG: DNA mismatch repair protein MutS [Candidatus Eisenbacteria bacterium]|uniref:DNA mismatch repair protein MutS n=1 Tax=Eiseniibacteriota bacterium TaxID=2212470 RepID=A0A956LYN0_UNCEI|nr:DNA mismatch repair protein MutS [Candidatus Eisenbacteria bacterium]
MSMEAPDTAAARRYRENLEARRSDVAAREGRERVLTAARLVIFVVFGILCWTSWGAHRTPLWAPVVPVVLFGALALVHEILIQERKCRQRAVLYYELGLRRLEGAWSDQGSTGERFLDPHHPYAADLDLFGSGSLFQRISVARTRAGEARLADWLLEPSPISAVRARQTAVLELRDEVDLRERLFVAGGDLSIGLHPEDLLAWSRAPVVLRAGSDHAWAWILAVLAFAGLVLWLGLGAGISPLAGAIVLQLIFRLRIQRRVQDVAHAADDAAMDLRLLSEVLAVFERRSFRSESLRRLRDSLVRSDADAASDRPASGWIKLLRREVDCLEARRNSLFAPIAFLFLWDVQFAFAIERWRERVGTRVEEWLDAVAELEALSSLAGYAFERPDDPFPELSEDATVFHGEEMLHPLVPGAVANSLELRASASTGPSLLVISGSNMSGKSTLLRTTGVLLVLALAGAPVSARRLVASRFALGASIQIHDSIQSGISHFYAEILRLRQIVELTRGEHPVLFLIDEILQGTNSHDRRVGVAAVLRSLVERGAVGMITTHDLALAEIADSLGPRARNVHFEDHLAEGRMVFDYRLRDGVVTHSNAIALMRAVGLDV